MEAHRRVLMEEPAGEVAQRRLEVDEADALIDGETLDLLEHRCVGRVEWIAAIHLARNHDADRWPIRFEGTDLHRRRVRAQQELRTDVERVLRIQRRMVFGEVERIEVIALGLDFGPHRAREAELTEDLANLVHDLRDDVQTAAPLWAARQREI